MFLGTLPSLNICSASWTNWFLIAGYSPTKSAADIPYGSLQPEFPTVFIALSNNSGVEIIADRVILSASGFNLIKHVSLHDPIHFGLFVFILNFHGLFILLPR